MDYEYVPTASPAGLRLHLNENTAGCSPRVLEALREVTREQTACYPDYQRAVEACARRLRVGTANVLLTNGLDEGILLAAMTALRGSPPDDPFQAVIVQPAFDTYAACTNALGGRVIEIPPQSDFFFPLQRVVDAITPKTRIIFLANPNNPTGLSIPHEIVAAVARAAPHALVLLDEAYADFSGETMMVAAASGIVPNLIVGRTFAKAYGLAGLRIGALVAAPERLAPMRRTIMPYTLNAFAAAALPPACEDVEYFDWYLAEVRASKALLYDVLARRGVRFWPSDGNFVLACFGEELPRVIARLARRGIIVRDRSGDPGCAGCARITAGVLNHTRQLVSALEEVLCGDGR
jgi:histidinol-phosphate aminotransferase